MSYSTWVKIIISVSVYLMFDRDLSFPVMCAVGAVSVLLCADLEINWCLHPPDVIDENVHRTRSQLPLRSLSVSLAHPVSCLLSLLIINLPSLGPHSGPHWLVSSERWAAVWRLSRIYYKFFCAIPYLSVMCVFIKERNWLLVCCFAHGL